jgi:hypothetical protein
MKDLTFVMEKKNKILETIEDLTFEKKKIRARSDDSKKNDKIIEIRTGSDDSKIVFVC